MDAHVIKSSHSRAIMNLRGGHKPKLGAGGASHNDRVAFVSQELHLMTREASVCFCVVVDIVSFRKAS